MFAHSFRISFSVFSGFGVVADIYLWVFGDPLGVVRILDIVYLQFFALRTASIFAPTFRRYFFTTNYAIKIATIFAKLKSAPTCPTILIISAALRAWSYYRLVFNPHLHRLPNIHGRHQARQTVAPVSSLLICYKVLSNLAAKCRSVYASHLPNQTALQV